MVLREIDNAIKKVELEFLYQPERVAQLVRASIKLREAREIVAALQLESDRPISEPPAPVLPPNEETETD